jgi:hypothetical protein
MLKIIIADVNVEIIDLETDPEVEVHLFKVKE